MFIIIIAFKIIAIKVPLRVTPRTRIADPSPCVIICCLGSLYCRDMFCIIAYTASFLLFLVNYFCVIISQCSWRLDKRWSFGASSSNIHMPHRVINIWIVMKSSPGPFLHMGGFHLFFSSQSSLALAKKQPLRRTSQSGVVDRLICRLFRHRAIGFIRFLILLR